MSIDSKVENEGRTSLPLTAELLNMIVALKAAKTLYVSETIIAERLSLPAPAQWYARCELLFIRDYREATNSIGVSNCQQVLNAMLNASVTDEMKDTCNDTLPKKYIFDAWGNGSAIIVEKGYSEDDA